LWSIALVFAYVLLAGQLFVPTYHHAVRTGFIACYSVETSS